MASGDHNIRGKIRPSKYDPKSGPEIPTKDRRTRCEISRELECYIPAKLFYGNTLDPLFRISKLEINMNYPISRPENWYAVIGSNWKPIHDKNKNIYRQRIP